MKVKLSPSMMCADLLRLKETLHTFEEEKIEYLHMDIMDGQFVPNYMLGTDFVAGVRKISHIPVDLHLMIRKKSWIGLLWGKMTLYRSMWRVPGICRRCWVLSGSGGQGLWLP